MRSVHRQQATYAGVHDSEVEPEEVYVDEARCYTRVRRRGAGILAVVGFCGCILAISKFVNAPTMDMDTPLDAFVNYDALPVSKELESHSDLCTPDVVKATCETLNKDTAESWDNDADKNMALVHALEISEMFGVSKPSVLSLFSKLKLNNKDKEDKEDATAVSCMKLCQGLVASFPAKRVPKKADVGCYQLQEKTHCVDVGPATLAKISLGGTASGPSEKESYLETKPQKDSDDDHDDAVADALPGGSHETDKEKAALEKMFYKDMSFEALSIDILNLFRIFPLLDTKVKQEGEASSTASASKKAPKKHQKTKASQGDADSDHDGDADSDHDSSGDADAIVADSDHDSGDADNGSDDGDAHKKDHDNDNGDAHKKDNHDGDAHKAHGDDGDHDNGDKKASSRRLVEDDWEAETLKVAVKARAYLSLALTKMTNKEVGDVVTKWFGNNLVTPTRAEVKRVLAGVLDMLNNVDYRFVGKLCEARTYAYVYPHAPNNKDEDGKFIFHLCDYYFDVNEDEKIETLIHEGAHHHLQSTSDEKWDGKTMYGRSLCSKVAEECATTKDEKACAKVLNNADNYCFFISDAVSVSAGNWFQDTLNKLMASFR